MANDARSGRKIKDDENGISKGRQTFGNRVTSLSTESLDVSSQRRSSRDTSSSKKNMTSSPSSIWKSECIEKRTSTTPPVQRKSEIVEKQTEAIPLRWSERDKKLSSPSFSGSKQSHKSLYSSGMKLKKEERDKSVEQFTMETKEVSCESEKQDAERVRARKKRISAHSYRALLKRNKNVKAKDQNKELYRMAKSSQGYSSNCEDDSSKQVNEVRGMSGYAEQAHVDCSMEENLQSPELLYKMKNGTLDDDIGLKRGQNVMPLKRKRKRNEVDMVSDASAVGTSKESSVPLADATPLSPTRCLEICGDKKQRVDNSDSTNQEILSSCLPASKEKMGGDACDPSSAKEFLTILTQTDEDDDKSKFNIISKVKQSRGTYCTTPLFGESRVEGMDEEHPHIFWTKLLEGKHPHWKYSSGSSQGSRKRVQYCDDVVKKQRKVANNCVNQSSGLEEGKIVSRDKEGTSAHSDTIHWNYASASTLDNNISETSRELSYSQKSLHVLLKPEMAKLCDVLQLREDVKEMVEKFLEYVMINHRVKREPATILQAFEISLCWIAASLRKQKIDHKASLLLAKQHLHFSCKKEEADYVYSLLQCLKKVFELSMKDASNYQSNARLSQLETSDMLKVKVEVDAWSAGQVCSDKQDHFRLAQKDFSRSIRGIKKKCQKQVAKLIQKQLEEKEDINKRYKERKTRLDHKKRTEAAVIRSYFHGKMQTNRLKVVDIKYAKQLKELNHERDMRLISLEALHVASMNKVRERETTWVEGVKSWLQAELLNKPLSNEFGHSVECLQAVEQRKIHDSNSIRTSEGQNPSKFVNITLVCGEGGVESSVIQETMPDEVVVCSNPFETVAGPLRLDPEGGELEIIASEATSVAGIKEQIEVGNSGNNHENNMSLNLCSREQILDGDMLSMPGGHIQSEVPETIGSSAGAEDCLPPVHSSDGQIHDGARLSPKGQVPGEETQTIGSNGLDNDVPVNAPSSIDQIPDGATTSMLDGEVLLRVPEAASPSNCTENFMSSPSEEEVNTGALLDVPDEEVPVIMSENVYPSDGLENVISLNASSIERFPDGATSCIPSAELLRVPESSPGEIVERGNINGDNYEAFAMTSENVNHNLHLQEQSVVNPPSVQTRTIIEDRPVPSNHALQDVCSEHTASIGVQVGDAAASEIQIALQVEPLPHPVDAVASNESYHGAAAPEPVVSGVGHQPSSENCSANQFAQSPTVVVENRVELSNHTLSDPVITSAQNPPTGPTDRLGANSLDTRTGIVFSDYINNTAQNAAPVASRLPQHIIPDPLQNELERLGRSADEAIGTHQETKLKMKAACDREIEEAIAQIRGKYEIKLQEMEMEFMLRKQELDANENKVLTNKIVAEAFRCKLMDMKSSSAGMQQDFSSSPIHQQLVHTPSQHTAERPPVFTGPSGPSAASVLTTATPAVTSPAANQHTAVPYPSARFSSIPSRLPNISSRVYPTVNLLVGRGIRAPASHSQTFRPSTSLTSTSVSSSVLPSLPSNPRPTSLPLLPPVAAYDLGLYSRALAAYYNGYFNRAPGSEASVQNLSQSATDLLMDFGSSVPIFQPESALQHGPVANPAQTRDRADVVCLLDDD